jgi:type IVB pilus formation R64 PilN family outer membrane protein
MKLKPLSYLAIAAVSPLMAACSVTHYGTDKRAEAVKSEITEQVDHQRSMLRQSQRPLYARIHANYVGRKSAPVALNSTLPPALNEVSFQLPRRTNLATAAKNIAKLTGYPVRINPDVYVSPKMVVQQLENTPGQQANKDAAMPGNLLSTQLNDGDTSLPGDFDGPLKDYMDSICGVLNINWEFDPIKGFYFYRLVTKVFEVKMNVGDNKVSASVGKGSNASTGSTSTSAGSGQSSGSFSGNVRASSEANYNSWNALEASLNAIRSPLGRIAVDVSTNSVLVRDTRDVVDLAETIINRGNQVHNRMIALEVRIMRVSYDDTSAAGLNAQATYNRLLSTGASKAQFTIQSPGSLVQADSGSLGFNILSPLSPWKGSEGMVQALNQLGTIVSDETNTYVTMNRRTQPIASYDTDTYLAETTPASGGGISGTGGAGVPGLKPATLTTGFFLSLTPTAFDDGAIWLDMNIDQSEKRGEFDKASTGANETFQQIQLPKTRNDSKGHFVAIKPGESLMLVSMKRDSMTHTNRTGIFGASGSGEHQREMQVIVVTPYVRSI